MNGAGEFRESHTLTLLSERTKTGAEWDIVLIQPGLSKNDFYYPPDVLRKSAKLFEGKRVSAYRMGGPLGDEFDHVPAQVGDGNRFAGNVVGDLREVHYGEFQRSDGQKGEGLLARFHILEGHKWLRDNLRDAWRQGRPDLLAFSIDARGPGRDALVEGKRVSLVERIDTVHELTVVSAPAAGGMVLRLVASEGKTQTTRDVYDLVRAHRPQWLQDFAAPEEGDDIEDHVLRVVESNLSRAEEAQRDIPVDEIVPLAEAARGVKTLQGVLDLLRAKKVDEAMRLLRNWISVYPVPEKGTPAQRVRGFYSLPYGQAGGGYPPAGVRPYGETPPRREAMPDETKPDPKAPEAPPPEVEKPAEEKKPEGTPAQESEREKQLAVRESALLVKERLAESGLPEKARARIAKLLEGRAGVKAEEVDAAITAEREYIESLREGKPSAPPKDLGDAHQSDAGPVVGKEPYNRMVHAFEGFFAGEDVGGVPRISSLHEAVGRITGKWRSPSETAMVLMRSMKAGFVQNPYVDHEDHLTELRETYGRTPATAALREAISSSDFTVAFGDAMFKRLQKAYREDAYNDWREIVSSFENLKNLTDKFKVSRIGGYPNLPVVPEGAPYQPLTKPTEAAEDLTPAKYGGLATVTFEALLADKVREIQRIPTKLARAAVRTIHAAVWNLIETNAVMGFDSVAMINVAHINHLTTDPALSYAELVNAILLIEKQTDQDTGKRLGLVPRKLITGRDLEATAIEITESATKIVTNEDATTRSFINRRGIKSMATDGLGLVSTTKNRWYLVTDPRDAEGIVVGFLNGKDAPSIWVQSPADTPTAGAAFTADQLTYKVMLGFGVVAVDWRWIAGSLKAS